VSASFRIDGLAELIVELQSLPDHLVGEAGHIVEGAANAAAFEIRSAYGRHRVTGNLQEHVVLEQVSGGRYGVKYRVKSTARHAVLFEIGTQARHTKTGANRGVMPAGGSRPPQPIFVPVMQRRRRRMYSELAQLLERQGLTVVEKAA
jgi:hypothetical protein